MWSQKGLKMAVEGVSLGTFLVFFFFFFWLPCFLYRPKIFTPQHTVVEGFRFKSLRSPKLKVLATKEIFAFSFFAHPSSQIFSKRVSSVEVRDMGT